MFPWASRASCILGALLLAGCSDYGLQEQKSVLGGDSASRFGFDTGAGDTADIVCVPDDDLADSVSVDESCASTPVFGTLDTVVEWELTEVPELREYGHVLMAPMVGPLADRDGDGDIDADDPPDIVVVMDDGGAEANNNRGALRVIAGQTGEVRTTFSGVTLDDLQVFPYRYTNVALGDIDGDGAPEIVFVANVVGGTPIDPGGGGTDTAPGGGGDTAEPHDSGIIVRPPPPSGEMAVEGPCRVAALDPGGNVKWVSDAPGIPCGSHAPALADLEGDGTVEVMVGPVLLEGATGVVRWTGTDGGGRPGGFTEAGWTSFAADLDGDGTQEVLAGSAIYAPDGSTRCVTGQADGFVGAADLDGAGDGEMVVVSNGTLMVFRSDCSLRMSRTLLGEGFGGPPAIGDLDGDGTPEIGIANAENYTVYEADGTVVWTMPVTDRSSSSTGSALFDFDGDGRLEVVYADEESLWIFDGTTGAVRLRDDTHSSRTLHEFPTVVDVDADGLTEIVVPNGGTHSDDDATGLYVLGSADGSWLPNRTVWNQHAYSYTNIDDDLSVPAHPTSNWPTYNTFRSGTIDPISAGTWPNAVPLVDSCVDECDFDRIVLGVRVGNQGLAGLRGRLPITVYAGDTPVITVWTDAPVARGGVSETVQIPLNAADFIGTPPRVVVDDDGGAERVHECREDDNAFEVIDAVCP